MAGELQIAYGTTGRTLYAVVRSAVGTVWNGATLVAYNGANWATYDVAMTEQGTSGYYAGDFPAVAAGVYNVEVRDQSGGSPATTDTLAGSGQVEWNGTVVSYLSSSATGQVRLDEDQDWAGIYAVNSTGNILKDVNAATDGTGVVLSQVAAGGATGIRGAVGLASANLDTQLSSISAAIAALNNPTASAIAQAILGQNVSAVEATMPEHSLGTLILAALESAVAGTVWTIKGTDGTTTRFTKTVTTNAAAEPITGVS